MPLPEGLKDPWCCYDKGKASFGYGEGPCCQVKRKTKLTWTFMKSNQSCCVEGDNNVIVDNKECTVCGTGASSTYLKSGQECCNGQPTTQGSCCNNEILKTGWKCCKENGKETAVNNTICKKCGTSYLESGQGCCRTVTPNESYDPGSQVCCSTGVKKGDKCPELCGGKDLLSNQECCKKVTPNEPYNPNSEVCCSTGVVTGKECPEDYVDCNGKEKKSRAEIEEKDLQCCPTGTKNAGWRPKSTECNPEEPKETCHCESGTPVGCSAETRCCGNQIWKANMCCQRPSGVIEY